MPLIILGFLAVFSGYLLAPGAPFKTEYFLEWVEPAGVEVEDVVFTPSGEASGHDDTEEAVGVIAPARRERVRARRAAPDRRIG